MQKNKTNLLISAGLLALALFGCTGPQGPTGPLGPTGPQGPSAPNTSPIYYYNQNFDGAGYSPTEWQTYVTNPGSMAVALDSSIFQSPLNSLQLSNPTAPWGSMDYTSVTIDTTKDLWVEFDWHFDSTNDEQMVYLNNSSVAKLAIGYNGSVYLVNTPNRYTAVSTLAGSTWHHVKMVLHPTGYSAYWFDDLSIGTNYYTNDTKTAGTPANAFSMESMVSSPGGLSHVDNVQCYHF